MKKKATHCAATMAETGIISEYKYLIVRGVRRLRCLGEVERSAARGGTPTNGNSAIGRLYGSLGTSALSAGRHPDTDTRMIDGLVTSATFGVTATIGIAIVTENATENGTRKRPRPPRRPSSAMTKRAHGLVVDPIVVRGTGLIWK